MVASAWSLENGAPGAGRWSMVTGARSLENGRWRMELLELVAGEWSLENGRWRMVAGACSHELNGCASWMDAPGAGGRVTDDV